MAYPCFHYLVHNLVKYVMAFFAPIRETSKFKKKLYLKEKVQTAMTGRNQYIPCTQNVEKVLIYT